MSESSAAQSLLHLRPKPSICVNRILLPDSSSCHPAGASTCLSSVNRDIARDQLSRILANAERFLARGSNGGKDNAVLRLIVGLLTTPELLAASRYTIGPR